MKTVTALLAAALLAAAAACGSSTPEPLTAGQLAHRIPGCHKPFTPSGGVSVQASTEQECITGNAEVLAATFSSADLERAWITAQQPGGCGAVQGHGWAMTVLPTVTDNGCRVETGVAKAAGGRLVSG